MSGSCLSWNRNEVKGEGIAELLSVLGRHYPIAENGEGLPLEVKLAGEGLRVEKSGGKAVIVASSVSLAARGVGMLLSGLVEDGQAVEEKPAFKTVGVMFDCCRNAVLKVDYLKEWLRRAALMGYNLAMLYTKDTYVLPDEEGFGYLRGSYTAAELREVDAYASQLGIEMTGCVQALGHLEPVLKWGKYHSIRDTAAELLTTEEKSYELINKILDFFGSVFKSRRIHLGMDETHGLGRGRYMDLNGYRRPFDIYVDHLNRVMGECDKRGLEPMIWSDMFFRMGSKNMDYYDRDAVTPPDVIAKIPPQVDLVYWDYYHEDVEFYREWIRRHHKLGHKPVMASAVWTWPVFWYNHRKTAATVTPCIEACAAEGVDEIIFTMWGDDGGYCDWSSALAGACYAAEKCFYPQSEPDEKNMAAKFSAICNGDYQAHVAASELTMMTEKEPVSAESLLWDDPLLGIYRKDCEVQFGTGFWPKQGKRYSELASRLEGCAKGGAGNLPLAGELARILEKKIRAFRAAEDALVKPEKVREAMDAVQAVAEALEKFEVSYRGQWYCRNKTFGYEVMQIRLSGQIARWKELCRRLEEIANGTANTIPELTERISVPIGLRCQYSFLATASVYY
jgi:hypothetical protein